MTAPADSPTNRQRILMALAEDLAASGGTFAPCTIASIVARAHVSRRTFYEEFSNREDCYLTLADEINLRIVAAVADTFASQHADDLSARVRKAVDRFIAFVASSPAVTRSLHRDLPALGEGGAEKRRTMLSRFADTMVDEFNRTAPHLSVDPDTALFIVAGLNEVVASCIEDGGDLNTLVPTMHLAIMNTLRGAPDAR